MNIFEATKEAAEKGKYITQDGKVFTKPTNTYDACIGLYGSSRYARWSPCPEDLIADDWKVEDFTEQTLK